MKKRAATKFVKYAHTYTTDGAKKMLDEYEGTSMKLVEGTRFIQIFNGKQLIAVTQCGEAETVRVSTPEVEPKTPLIDKLTKKIELSQENDPFRAIKPTRAEILALAGPCDELERGKASRRSRLGGLSVQ